MSVSFAFSLLRISRPLLSLSFLLCKGASSWGGEVEGVSRQEE